MSTVDPCPLCLLTAVLGIRTVTTLGQSFPSLGLSFFYKMMGLDRGDLLGLFLAGPPSGISISIGRTPWFLKSSLPGRHLVTPLRAILEGAHVDLQ